MSRFRIAALLTALAALAGLSAPARAGTFSVTDLVESPNFVAPAGFEGTGTPLIDPNLVNPWGMSHSPTSPLWVSNQNSGAAGVPTATLYRGFVNGSAFTPVPLIVQMPTSPGPFFRNGPTGQVFNTTAGSPTAFSVGSPGTPAVFIFAQRNGMITGWNPGANLTHALPINGLTPTAGAAYTGLALTPGAGGSLFAANNDSNTIDRFDQNGTKTPFTFNFSLTNGKTANAFNVQELSNGKLYATFSFPGTYGGAAAKTGGAIAIIDPNTGAVLKSFVSQPGGVLNGPWGLALAPADFGQFGGDLLVGNFDGAAAGQGGVIDAFDPNTLAFLGTLNNPDGTPIMIPGLWGLLFGNGTAGRPATLFATGGGPGENEGILVAIDPTVPEPSSAALCLVAGAGAGLFLLRRRRARPE